MLTKDLTLQIARDLIKLKKEISLYKNESDIWRLDKQINNTAGNLALHICGNLKHYIGAQFGNTGYIRERDKEFSDKNISSLDLQKNIDETIAIIEKSLPTISDATLNSIYPINVFNKELSVAYMLVHFYGHLNYHLGQINYHRRLLEDEA